MKSLGIFIFAAGATVLVRAPDAMAAQPPLPPDGAASLEQLERSDWGKPPVLSPAVGHSTGTNDAGVGLPGNSANGYSESEAESGPGAAVPERVSTPALEVPLSQADPAAAPVPSAPDAAPETTRAPLEGPPIPLSAPLRLADTTRADAAESAWPALAAQPDRPVSLDLRDASLPSALQAVARFTGLNLVISERVRGTVSLHLDNVPWRGAFDALLDANGLAAERHGSVLWVAPASELADRARQRFEAHARTAELEPLASRSFTLNYPRAAEVARLLSGAGAQRALSRRGSAIADPRMNLLFVTDLPARLDQIAALLELLDRPSRQVLIEARIVEGERGFSRNLGVRLATRAAYDAHRSGIVGGRDGTLADLSARPVGGFEAATAGLTLFTAPASRLLDIELSALEADGKGQIVSSPRVVTGDRIKAIVEQGTELPYQARLGRGIAGVQFRRATLKLEVEPQVTPDGHLILDLDIAKDSVGEDTAAGPAIHTRHVQTRVAVENGGTVSIGGIYTSDERDDVTRVPLLGKIPVIGALFRHRARRETQGELVVYITPRVVGGPAAP